MRRRGRLTTPRGVGLRRGVRAVVATVTAIVVVLAVAVSGALGAGGKQIKIAYLSYAVANSYDSAMLAAAQATAAANHAKLTVLDANNSAATQYSQLQDVIATGKHTYAGVIVQPILGTNLLGLVKQAIAKGFKVGNMDQILGPNLGTDADQVKGLAANDVFVPTQIGQRLGKETVLACQQAGHTPCQVGFIYGVKGSSVDTAVFGGFNKVIAGKSIQVVGEGQSLFSIQGGLTAAQNILTANPNLDVFVGNEQSMEGASQALQSAGKHALVISWGGAAVGLQAVAAGTYFADPITLPASEGRFAVADLIKAIRTGKAQPPRNVLDGLPHGGIATKGTAKSFTAEWPG